MTTLEDKNTVLSLGATRGLDASARAGRYSIPPAHLLTHGVIVGMTGSGKTGLLMVMVEEALRCGVPVVMLDVKGDLANLALAFEDTDPERFIPWIDTLDEATLRGRAPAEVARELASAREASLREWKLSTPQLAQLRAQHALRIITPGSTAGEPLHLLSSLERRSDRWTRDPESARDALSTAVSLLLRLVGRDPDPAQSTDHVLLSVLATRRLANGQDASLPSLLADLESPPIERVGAMELEDFAPRNARRDLASALNNLLASPMFTAWREGASLDPGEWLSPREDGRVNATIVSVSHLDDDERALVLGVVLEELLTYVRSLPGSGSLRALVVLDEAYGLLPPHPANPPTRRPMLSLFKQARSFGVGVLVATQNPMDLDYRALSNAGFWAVGRLQTDADRARVIEGLTGVAPRATAGGRATKHSEANTLANTVKKLLPRWFVVRNAHRDDGCVLLNPRHAMSWLRGPMTRAELRRVRAEREP